MIIKSFGNKIASSTVDTIPLSTNNGSTGYRIKKFEVFPGSPGTEHYEATLKIYSIPQTTASVSNAIDFSDNTLIGAAYFQDDNAKHYPSSMVITFDNVTFNQDIYVTYIGTDGATAAMNYHIELEQIKLALDENTVATLKDMRNIASQ